MLFLGYTFTLCIFVAILVAATFPYDLLELATAKKQTEIDIVPVFVLGATGLVAVTFGLTVSALFFYHIYLLRKNLTTIEHSYHSSKHPSPYDLGAKANF